MNRSKFNLVIDLISFLGVLGLAITGMLMSFALPPGSGRDTLWGWTRHDWGDAHFWLAMALIGLLVVHLALHWGWVCVMVGRVCGREPGTVTSTRRWVSGGLFMLTIGLIIGAFLWLAIRSVAYEPTGDHQRRRGWNQQIVQPAEPVTQTPIPAT